MQHNGVPLFDKQMRGHEAEPLRRTRDEDARHPDNIGLRFASPIKSATSAPLTEAQMPFNELSARVGYAGNDLDRQSEKRDDAAYVAALQADPESRTVVVSGVLRAAWAVTSATMPRRWM